MIDTHAHLMLCEAPLSDLMPRAESAGVVGIVNVATTVATSHQALAQSQTYPMVYPTVGIHPCSCHDGGDFSDVETLARTGHFVALGETGLDAHWRQDDQEDQQRLFKQHLALGRELGLPVIIHNRKTDQEILDCIQDYPDVKKVFHCFASGSPFYEETLSENHFYSFTGGITFSKRGKTLAALRKIPLEKIMLETDCPYMAPQAYQGRPNEPSFLKEIAIKIAEVKDVPIETVIEETTKTARSFFGIA